ncbi:MAG: HlyD family efflux transporter periplasmic adaptor subunit [Pirellulaceae bacterium]|nr:HlyD family efflux transporter periplasmic adaptor subunit [Pirellulaceae bacterium]
MPILPAAEEPESASDEKSKVTKLTGVLEGVQAAELKMDTEHLGTLKIKRILPHGAEVTKGQNVVWLETEEIDKQIKDAETEFKLAQVALDAAEFDYKQFLKTQALDKAGAERSRKKAQQDFDNFVQVDRERQILAAKFSLKSAQSSYDNAVEELKQLEQMYKEDDLTEESEEIVLKRAKQSVEFAEHRLEGSKITADRTIKQSIPRTALQQKDTLARAELTYEKAISELESARKKRDIELAKERDKFKEQEKKLAELRGERKKIVLQSPIDGIVFHGKLTRGKLSDKPSTIEVGTKVTATQVIATVVNPSKLQIRTDIPEKDLQAAKVGEKVKVTVLAFPDTKLTGTIKSVSSVPFAGTKFDGVVTFPQRKDHPPFLPTIGCEVQIGEEPEKKADVGEEKDAADDKAKKDKKDSADEKKEVKKEAGKKKRGAEKDDADKPDDKSK